MEKLNVLKKIRREIGSILWYFALQGIVLVTLGVLVVFYPQILILLFAFFFVFVGLLSLWAAIKVHRAVKHFDKFFDLFR